MTSTRLWKRSETARLDTWLAVGLETVAAAAAAAVVVAVAVAAEW